MRRKEQNKKIHDSIEMKPRLPQAKYSNSQQSEVVREVTVLPRIVGSHDQGT